MTPKPAIGDGPPPASFARRLGRSSRGPFGVNTRRAKPCVHRPRHPGASWGSISQATIAHRAVLNGLVMAAYINHLRHDIRQRGRRE